LTKCRSVRFVLPRWKFVCEAKERKVEIMYVAYIWQCRIDPPAFFIILCSTPGIGGGRNDVCTVHGSSHFLLPADGFFFFFFKRGKKRKTRAIIFNAVV
jgi:hypothetical protein